MKLLLISDSGEQVACLQNVEEYGVKDSNRVFAMLDVLESLIAAAKGGHGKVGKQQSLFAGGTSQIAL